MVLYLHGISGHRALGHRKEIYQVPSPIPEVNISTEAESQDLGKNIQFGVFRAEIFILWCIVHIVHIFRSCALPPSGPDRAQRQQSKLITPPNVWHTNQDRIKNFGLYTHF